MYATSVHADVDIDEHVEVVHPCSHRGGGNRAQRTLVVDGNAERIDLRSKIDQRGDLGWSDDLVSDEDVGDAAVGQSSRLADLGTGHSDGASVDQHVRKLR